MVTDFAKKITERLPNNIKLSSLKLQETESSYAEWVSAENN
jgi:6-pyruvoyltetrahydropterin/6-carboxytetrahydropterin synthase